MKIKTLGNTKIVYDANSHLEKIMKKKNLASAFLSLVTFDLPEKIFSLSYFVCL